VAQVEGKEEKGDPWKLPGGFGLSEELAFRS